MRLAVLSDVHSNLPALQAVLADVDRVAPDGIWVAGDLVGYNPWPNEVLEILRERHVRAIRGNHDRAAIGGETFRFNELAAEAIRWTRVHLAPAGVGYLKELEDPTGIRMPEGLVAMYHGVHATTTSTSRPGPPTNRSSARPVLRTSFWATRTSRW